MENNPFKPKARFIFHAFTGEAEWLMAFTFARRRNPKSADHSCMPRQDGVGRNFPDPDIKILIHDKTIRE